MKVVELEAIAEDAAIANRFVLLNLKGSKRRRSYSPNKWRLMKGKNGGAMNDKVPQDLFKKKMNRVEATTRAFFIFIFTKN